MQILNDIYHIHKAELEKIKDETKRYDLLVEEKVTEQTENIIEMDCIQSLMNIPDYPEIYGWVFDMRSCRIVELNIHSSTNNNIQTGRPLLLIRKLKSFFSNKRRIK